jgi:hypothetical protein
MCVLLTTLSTPFIRHEFKTFPCRLHFVIISTNNPKLLNIFKSISVMLATKVRCSLLKTRLMVETRFMNCKNNCLQIIFTTIVGWTQAFWVWIQSFWSFCQDFSFHSRSHLFICGSSSFVRLVFVIGSSFVDSFSIPWWYFEF